MPYTAQIGLPYAAGSDTSLQAAQRAARFVGVQGEQVWQWVANRGDSGATMAEAEQQMPIRRSSACARFNALMKAGRLVKTGARRDGCSVYVAKVNL